jgi:hypothetical protein
MSGRTAVRDRGACKVLVSRDCNSSSCIGAFVNSGTYIPFLAQGIIHHSFRREYIGLSISRIVLWSCNPVIVDKDIASGSS